MLNKLANGTFNGVQRWATRGDIAAAERRGARLGRLWMRLDRKHRERTYANLRLAFPEWNDAAVEGTATKVFEHFGMLLTDFLRSGQRSNEEVLASATIEGLEHLETAESVGKGIIALTAHFGNWERFAQYCTASGRSITVVARDADDDAFQDRVQALRERTGIRVLSRGNAARGMLGVLRRNEMIGILPDQNSKECFVPFFGHPAGTVLGPVVLGKRTGAPMLPAFCVRTGVGQYHVMLQEPILVSPESDNESLAAEMNLRIERAIRRYPEQYLWVHDRWKSARQAGLVP